MGVSRLTALIIASANPIADAAQSKDGKWQGIICHNDDHRHHPRLPLLSTGFIYESQDAALVAMVEQIEIIKNYVDAELPEA